jgi:hypothetical protein
MPDRDYPRVFFSAGSRRPASLGIVFLMAGIGLMAMLLSGGTPTIAQEKTSMEEPKSAQLGEDVVPMDKSFQGKPSRPSFLPWFKGGAPFFRDTILVLNLRTYYMDHDNFDNTKNEAWALGGSLSYQSGWFLDHFGMGAAIYTSQPLYAPDDTDGTLLLKPGQESYTVVGQLYGSVKIVDEHFITVYRSEINTPYINKNDSRMTPNTFEGYTFRGISGGKDGAPKFAYGGGYVEKIKPQNSDTFIPMSKAAGAQINRGVVAGGADISSTTFAIGAIDYYSKDIINIGYAEAKYTTSLTSRLGLVVSAQFTDQRSVGEDLLTGNSFATSQVGVKAAIGFGGGLLFLAYTRDSSGANLQSPWSSYPGYTNVQVQSFNRAGEEASMVMGSYDFSRLNLEHVTAYALWVHGWGAIDPLTKDSVYQQDEYDFDLQWLPKSGGLNGFWFRFRYAHVDQRGVSDASANDFRFIVNYDLSHL